MLIFLGTWRLSGGVFGGCVFEVWPAPGARESLQKCGGLRPPTFLRAFAFPGPLVVEHGCSIIGFLFWIQGLIMVFSFLSAKESTYGGHFR